MIGLVYSV